MPLGKQLRAAGRLLAASLLLLTIAVLPADEPKQGDSASTPTVRLQYKFATGQRLKYRTEQTVTQRLVTPKGQKTDVSRAEQDRVFTVTGVQESGLARASMQFARVHMEVRTDDHEPLVYDSSMSADKVPPRFRVVAEELKKAAPEFDLSATGTPVDEKGTEITDKAGQACFMIALPPDEVSVGDNWVTHLNVDVRIAPGVMREIRLMRSYKLAALEDGIAEIRFFTSVQSPVRSAHIKSLLLQATPQGTIQFDVARGCVVRKELKFDKFVLGAMGPNTMLSAKGWTVEQLLEGDEDEETNVTLK